MEIKRCLRGGRVGHEAAVVEWHVEAIVGCRQLLEIVSICRRDAAKVNRDVGIPV